MSTAWILVYFLPIILVLAWYVVLLITLFSAISTLPRNPPLPDQPIDFTPVFQSVFVLIPFIYLIVIVNIAINVTFMYKLAKRRNTHFKRQNFLTEDILASIKTAAAKKRVEVEVTSASMDRTLREAKAEETEKNAVLWALVSVFIPFASWYVYYFLMKDFYRHERREDGLLEDVGKTLDKFGVKFSMPRRTEPVPDRSFAFYLILTIITVGIFGVYWLYTLLKDPNNHFKYHIQIEEPLLGALENAYGVT
jgi:hypothetical protein